MNQLQVIITLIGELYSQSMTRRQQTGRKQNIQLTKSAQDVVWVGRRRTEGKEDRRRRAAAVVCLRSTDRRFLLLLRSDGRTINRYE